MQSADGSAEADRPELILVGQKSASRDSEGRFSLGAVKAPLSKANKGKRRDPEGVVRRLGNAVRVGSGRQDAGLILVG